MLTRIPNGPWVDPRNITLLNVLPHRAGVRAEGGLNHATIIVETQAGGSWRGSMPTEPEAQAYCDDLAHRSNRERGAAREDRTAIRRKIDDILRRMRRIEDIAGIKPEMATEPRDTAGDTAGDRHRSPTHMTPTRNEEATADAT